MSSSDATKKLGKKELRSLFLRSFSTSHAWHFERQQHMAFCWSMIPAIKKLYDRPEDRIAAYQRHLEFYNCHTTMQPLIGGIVCAMEEENANNEEFDTSSISSMKVALMGPLAGIGDSLIGGTLRIIATGVGVSLAAQGNILGPLLFLLLFNIPAQGLRFYLMHAGYKLGSGFLAKVQESGLMEILTYGASVLGLMVIGGMTAENVAITVPLVIGSGETATTLGDICNTIMPGLLPLAFTLLMYWLVSKKNVKTTTLLVALVVVGLAGSFFGILGV